MKGEVDFWISLAEYGMNETLHEETCALRTQLRTVEACLKRLLASVVGCLCTGMCRGIG